MLAALYAILLATAYASARSPVEPSRARSAGAPERASRPGPRRPVATLAALVVVGVPTLVQLAVAPGLLGSLERNWSAIRAGQVWRLVTSLVVQDGGVAGTIFNLASLAVIGPAAERVWAAGQWVVIALAAGVGAQFWGAVVQPVGGGNSVAVFGLAASVAAVALRRGGGPSWPRAARPLGAVSLLVGLVLLVVRDLHGGAAVIGAALGWLLPPRGGSGPVDREVRE